MQGIVIIFSSLATGLVVGLIVYHFQKKAVTKAIEDATRRVGRPAELGNADLFFGSKSEPVVIHHFKKMSSDKEFSEMTVGVGIISHPEFPNSVGYFTLVFETGKPIMADGKTKYYIRKTNADIYYLHQQN